MILLPFLAIHTSLFSLTPIYMHCIGKKQMLKNKEMSEVKALFLNILLWQKERKKSMYSSVYLPFFSVSIKKKKKGKVAFRMMKKQKENT